MSDHFSSLEATVDWDTCHLGTARGRTNLCAPQSCCRTLKPAQHGMALMEGHDVRFYGIYGTVAMVHGCSLLLCVHGETHDRSVYRIVYTVVLHDA